MTTYRTIATIFLFALLSGPLMSSDQPGAAKQDESELAARALVDRAVKAVGGQERLQKIRAISADVKGDFIGVRNLSVHFSATAKGCDQYRLEMSSFQKNPLGAVLIGNGEKSWIKGTDAKEKFNTKLMPLKDLLFDAGMSQDLYAIQLTQFLPALKTKEFTLSIVGEDKVGERPAQVFRVSRAGRPDVNIFLDKETALPIKCEVRIRAMKTNDEFVHEVLLSDYKDVDGVKHFTKIALSRDGTRIFEAELSGIQFPEKVDAKMFAEP